MNSIHRKTPNYSLFAWGLIFFFTLLQAIRWKMLPQFIDDYYHLLVAQNFIKAGGWVGWDFFEYAPWGRPHLYPPVYHLILSFFLKTGVKPLILLKTTEVLAVPAFFVALFGVTRKLYSDLFAFFAVLLCGSYFHFFVSLTSNIPATWALVLGLTGCLGLIRKDIIVAAGCLLLCVYTHTGVSLAFLLGIALFSVAQRRSLRFSFTVFILVVILSLPLWIHQIQHMSLVRYRIAAESRFVHINIAVLLSGCAGICVLLRKKSSYYLILALIAGFSIVFFKYFYRYFAAQGFLPWALASSAWCAAVIEYTQRNVTSKILFFLSFFALWGLFFFFTPTFALNDLKPSFMWADSTFNNYSSGDLFKSVPYNTLYSQRYFSPVVGVISKETDAGAIITSNSSIVSVMAAALTNRFTADALFREVKPMPVAFPGPGAKRLLRDTFSDSGVVIWIKSNDAVSSPDVSAEGFYARKHQLALMYENELFSVYRALEPKPVVQVPRSRYPLWFMYSLLFGICLVVCIRTVRVFRRV